MNSYSTVVGTTAYGAGRSGISDQGFKTSNYNNNKVTSKKQDKIMRKYLTFLLFT